MNSYFEAIGKDFQSSQMPQAADPGTIKSLCRIIDSIQKGETTLEEFEHYLVKNTNLPPSGYTLPFGVECYEFVSSVLTYLKA